MNRGSMELNDVLRAISKPGVSDIHFKAGRRPLVRLHGRLLETQFPTLTPEHTWRVARSMLGQRELLQLQRRWPVCCAYEVEGLGRYRATFFRQRGSVEVVMRFIPHRVPDRRKLGLPNSVESLVTVESGLVILTGPTSNGRSTTAAWIIGQILARRPVHVLSIEKPVEFVFEDDVGVSDQIQVGTHAADLDEALRMVGRQNVDVLLLGIPLDPDLLRWSMRFARAGLLVLAYLSVPSAFEALQWILDAAPPERQHIHRETVAQTLQAIVGQRLLRCVRRSARVAAVETIRMTGELQEALRRQSDPAEIRRIQAKAPRSVMQTLEAHLVELADHRLITVEQALAAAMVPSEIERALLIR